MGGVQSLVLQAWWPSGSPALVWVVHRPKALGLYAGAAMWLIRLHTHPRFQVWAPRTLIWVHTNQASGVCWGCLSGVHSPGAEGVEAQEATWLLWIIL